MNYFSNYTDLDFKQLNKNAIQAFMSDEGSILKIGTDSQGKKYLQIQPKGIWAWIAINILNLNNYNFENVRNHVKNQSGDFNKLDKIDEFYTKLDRKFTIYVNKRAKLLPKYTLKGTLNTIDFIHKNHSDYFSQIPKEVCLNIILSSVQATGRFEQVNKQYQNLLIDSWKQRSLDEMNPQMVNSKLPTDSWKTHYKKHSLCVGIEGLHVTYAELIDFAYWDQGSIELKTLKVEPTGILTNQIERLEVPNYRLLSAKEIRSVIQEPATVAMFKNTHLSRKKLFHSKVPRQKNIETLQYVATQKIEDQQVTIFSYINLIISLKLRMTGDFQVLINKKPFGTHLTPDARLRFIVYMDELYRIIAISETAVQYIGIYDPY